MYIIIFVNPVEPIGYYDKKNVRKIRIHSRAIKKGRFSDQLKRSNSLFLIFERSNPVYFSVTINISDQVPCSPRELKLLL